MKKAINETNSRRTIQKAFNEEHGITPQTIKKDVRELIQATYVAEEVEELTTKDDERIPISQLPKKERAKVIENLEVEMKEAARNLEFERATELRDIILEMKA